MKQFFFQMLKNAEQINNLAHNHSIVITFFKNTIEIKFTVISSSITIILFLNTLDEHKINYKFLGICYSSHTKKLFRFNFRLY